MTQTLISSLNPWGLPAAALPSDSDHNGKIRHIFALFNPLTIDGKILTIHTATSSYADVHREIAHQKGVHYLAGYEVRSILESPCGF